MWALTHTATGLQCAYALVLIPMIVGLIRGHASLFQYVQALWWALRLTVICVIILFLVSQFLHDMHSKTDVLQFVVAVNVFAWWGYLLGLGLAEGPPSVRGHLRGPLVSAFSPPPTLWWPRRALP